MDDLIKKENADNYEGLPLSPKEMGIQESSIGGGGEAAKPTELKEELKEIFNPLFSTLGHGTRIEAAEEINQNGLRAKYPDLGTTTLPLFDGSRSYDEQMSQVVDKISHWPHYDAKAVVVVMIPNPKEGEMGGSQYFNSVFQELPEEDTGYNARFLIPPSYVKGYVNVETGSFVPNPKFRPEKLTVKPNSETFVRKAVPIVDNSDIPIRVVTDDSVPKVW